MIEYRNEKGKRHRTDGPAVEHADGSRSWWVDVKTHRVDGPAREWANGSRAWYLVNSIALMVLRIKGRMAIARGG